MLRRILYTLGVLTLLFLIGMAWYVSNKGFTRRWRSYIVSEFRKAGVEVHIKRLTLDPFRGLVAREVSVLDARDRKRVLAWVDEMLLGVNYASAIRGETFLDSADLRDANLWLPLDDKDPDGPKIAITKLNARFYLPPQQIYLARAQAEVHGIQLLANGRLINPQAFRPKRASQNTAVSIGAQIIEELGKLKYGGEPPVLSCEFSGDLASADQIQVDLRFSAKNVKRKNYEFRTVDLVAGCRKGVVEIQRLNATDSRGELLAAGTYDLGSGAVDAHIRSSLHVDEIHHAFGWFPHFENWSLVEPPKIDFAVEGALDSDEGLRVTGHAELQRSSYKQIPFQRLSTDFSWQHDSWSFRDFHLSHAKGEVSGDVVSQPGEFRAKLSSTLPPKVIESLLEPSQAEWVEQFDFPASPQLELIVTGTKPNLQSCEAAGTLSYTDALLNGIPLKPATSAISYRDDVLAVGPISPARGAQTAPFTQLFDFARHEIRQQPSTPQTPNVKDGQ